MRGTLSHARLSAAAFAALVAVAVTAPAALADSATSTANGLSVTAALSPDSASKGQTVTQRESVKNVTDSSQLVAIRIIGPRQASAPVTLFVKLAANATFSQSASFPADLLSKGSHSLTVIAVNTATGSGASASASITVS